MSRWTPQGKYRPFSAVAHLRFLSFWLGKHKEESVLFFTGLKTIICRRKTANCLQKQNERRRLLVKSPLSRDKTRQLRSLIYGHTFDIPYRFPVPLSHGFPSYSSPFCRKYKGSLSMKGRTEIRPVSLTQLEKNFDTLFG